MNGQIWHHYPEPVGLASWNEVQVEDYVEMQEPQLPLVQSLFLGAHTGCQAEIGFSVKSGSLMCLGDKLNLHALQAKLFWNDLYPWSFHPILLTNQLTLQCSEGARGTSLL